MRNTLLTRIVSFISYLRIITRENDFISAFSTNAVMVYTTDVSGEYGIKGIQQTLKVKNQDATNDNIMLGCSTRNLITDAYFPSDINSSLLMTVMSYLRDASNSVKINGFFVGCLPFEALLQSTLDCLYDINCLRLFSKYFPNFNQVYNRTDLVLSDTNEGRSINELVNDLFINQWTTQINYSNYFSQCAPSYCTYVKTNQNNISYTVTLFISLYGGLIIILRLMTPILINILLKLKQKFIVGDNRRNLQNFVFIEWIKKLNLFKLATERTENDIKQQRTITRVYLVLLSSKNDLKRIDRFLIFMNRLCYNSSSI